MDPMNILVITNETAEGEVLLDTVRSIALRSGGSVLVVAPALNSRFRHFMSDEDGARAAAAWRVAAFVGRLLDAGVDARGVVGDADPMVAIADALVSFDADELIVATHPPARSNWLERDLVARACARFDLPVAHIVVDVEVGAERLVMAA
jgi:hypothetical protein